MLKKENRGQMRQSYLRGLSCSEVLQSRLKNRPSQLTGYISLKQRSIVAGTGLKQFSLGFPACSDKLDGVRVEVDDLDSHGLQQQFIFSREVQGDR